MPTLNPNLYTIAWIAPLEIEAQAALHMLDKIHAGGFPVGPGDDYVFHAGEICGHNVVIATFATVQPYGTSSVTSLASYIRKHFPNLWFGLLVGVAAGLPNLTSSPPRDIRLGDILVAQPVAESPAIIPYGLGKQKGGMGFELLPSGHSLPQAERIVRSTIAKIKAVNQDTEAVLGYYKMMADTTTKFPDPGQENDTLCLPGDNIPVRRERRRDTERIRVWYGPLGSGDKLLKSSRDRDELRDRYNLIGLETEAAGVMNEIPVGNIRGVCDYGNEQKNKDWQPFAAVMAAAFTKVVLSEIPPKSAVPSIVPRIVFTVEDKACLRDLLVTNPEDERQRIEDTKGALLNDSFRWILDNAEFRNWHCNPQSQVLWIKGNPGTGKTMLIIGIIKELLRQKQPQSSRTIAYFLCQATDPKLNNATGVLRGLIYMMIDQQPHLVSHLRKRYESEPKLFENGDLFYSLSVIFENMVRDSKHTTIYLLIDALDECEVDLRRLIMLIRKPCPNSQVDVKWIVSSRNRDDIKQLINFDNGEVKLSLDLNARYLSDATHISMNESPVLEYSQFLRRERTSIEPTDSGYASTTHQKDLPQEGYRTKYIHDVQRTVPGEEGFSSAPAAASRGKTEDDDGDDTESIYTAGPGISSSGQRSYICELVDDLFRKIQHGQETQHIPERIHGILSRLLKAFAMRFGQFGSTQIHLDIMVFIRRHRGEIANSLRMKYLEEDQTDSQFSTHDDTKMELDDIMGLWDQHLEDTDDDVGTPQVQSGEESPSIDEDIRIADDDEDLPGLTAYRELITGSPVYEWLLGSLRRGLHLHPAEPNVQDAIRNRIIDSLPSSRRVSRYDQPRIYQVVFLLNWDPSAFITEQEHDLSKEGFLSKIITITGTSQDAQAMTCLQYLHQTWHLYGSDILQLVEATLLDERDYEHRCILSDNTQLAAWVNDKQFCVEVTGIADSIAEIGEQLAWLGSALRSSPHASGISYCTPFVSNAKVEGTSIPTSQAPPITRISCGIDFKHDDQEQSRSTSPMGQCWHHLFRNPTVVMGFPIPYRSRQGIGLEIPLNILAGLVQANQVDAFSDKLFIKGFSNLLIPTEYIRDQDQMIWHLCYNVQGDRISYLDGIGAHVGHITLADLESSRHILGWCSDARFYAGAVDANYSINRSWLEPPSSCCSLKNTFIAAGRLITGGDPAIYGNRDIPYRLIRDEYIEKLSWIARQYVVMWDAGEKRGWLVNGASALLHLLLASLHFNRTDPLGFAFRLNLTDIRVPEKTSTPSSAMEILLDPDNLSLKLYHAKQSEPNETTLPPAQLRDRVDRLYNLLEKIMDHQVNIMGTDNRVSRNMARGNLEGWDFKDLSTQEDPLYPRFCKLGTRGKSWVDLTRSIRAATLFGTGFGEILRPLDTSQLCLYWSRLPEGKSYLAVSGYDLAHIIDRFGNPHSNPVRLTHDLIWCNSPDNGAPACKCVGCPEQTDHSELAQVILPSQFKKRIPKHNTVRSSSWRHGGVVFGYNKDLRWCWKDTGSPKQEDALPSSDDSGSDSDGDFYDSGLGTSFAPSATVDGSGRLPSSMSTLEGSSHEDYEVGIVCALPKELLAVRAMFDSIYSELENDQNDPNCYCLGRIKAFNVVAAGLPDGDYGMNSATNVASHLTRTFRRVKFCLVVGIGGGVPSAAQDIRLGDVVVGTSVIQVDMGKWIQDSEFRMTADTQRPPHFLRSVITKIKAVYSKSFDSAVNPLLGDLKQISTHEPQYQYPGADRDTLFDSDYVHVEDEPTCDKCIGSRRPRIRQHDGPNIFYGRIASGNQVVRDAKYRERLGREGVSCVEMEGAGVMRTTDCLVIRGICDYADSHKNKQWQEYAAATAAAYAKFFLSCMRYSDDEFAIRVPSQLEASMGPIPLQKQKRAAPCTDFGQPLVLKRTRRN